MQRDRHEALLGPLGRRQKQVERGTEAGLAEIGRGYSRQKG